MIDAKKRLEIKNKFDGSIVFKGNEFDDKTGRTVHMDNCRNIIDDDLVDESSGLIKEEYSIDRCCPLCDSCGDHNTVFVKQGFNHVKCSKCGFFFVNNPFVDDILHDKYLKEDSWSEVLLNDVNIKLDTKKFEYGLMILGGIIKDNNIDIDKSLLDIGSGSGLFLKIVDDAGWNAKGIEFNEKTRKFSEDTLGVEVVDKLIQDIDKSEKYGVISLWNVLEHIVETKNFIEQIHERLNDNGVLFISVPNADCLSTMLRKERSNTFLGASHVNFFNVDYLDKFLSVNGFELLHAETYVSEINNIKEYLGMFYKNKRIDGFLNILTPELIDKNLLGSKLIAVYKKRVGK